MASRTFGAYFDIVPPKSDGKTTASPQAAVAKPSSSKQIPPIAPDAVELDDYSWGAKYNCPRTEYVTAPQTPNELKMNRPPSPKADDAVSPVQSFWNPWMNRWRVLSACTTYFLNGMNDSVPGAIIPYLEVDYNIGYAIVSLVFVANAVGFITSAFIIEFLHSRLGRARLLMLSEFLMVVGYVMLVCTPPFPVVVLSYFFIGSGEAINLALNNVFCANLANSSVILGAAHGSYGIGGTIGPIAATALASSGILWSRFFFILLGIAITNIAFAGWAFWTYEKETPSERLNPRERAAGATTDPNEDPSKYTLLKRALRNRATLLGALFIFAYQGAEVAISGWVISFLITYRNGDPSQVGYVTAGFWAGITVGRFVLTHVAHRVGEKRAVYALTAGSMAFQLLVWWVPNVISNAVFVALLGLLLGPVYPCAMTILTKALPRNIQMVSIGFVSSAGSSGGAVAPFTTGLLAQAAGTWTLHPVCLGMFVVMVICWWAIPDVEKRDE